jgi:hypothetical protein
MSCFWDGLIHELRRYGLPSYVDPRKVVSYLKNENTLTRNVLWQSHSLSDKQLQENFTHVRIYDSNSIGNGYDCSSCDPFLLLLCEVFRVHIDHVYMGARIHYMYAPHSGRFACVASERPTLRFSSSSSHFSAG